MFGLDLAVDGVLDQFCDWIYGKLISFFGDFFSMINMMGAELFELEWIWAHNDPVDTVAGENEAMYYLHIDFLAEVWQERQ